jgi:glycosyltransferase involved in cell wall biosynthesis
MRLLWLVRVPPWPPYNGGQIRSYNLARELMRRGHEIEIWCISQQSLEWDPAEPDQPVLRSLPARTRAVSFTNKLRALVSAYPELGWELRTKAVRLALGDAKRIDFDAVVLAQSFAAALLPELRTSGMPIVLDAHNVEADLEREVATVLGGLARMRILVDAAKTERLERKLVRSAAAVVAVSDYDAARLGRHGPSVRVAVHPNGVDLEFFTWADHSAVRRRRLLMTGTLGYPPNIEACRWLTRTLMPAIRRRIPDASLELVGSSPAPEVLAMNNPSAGIRVIGQVSDVRPHLSDADVFIVPLQSGGGTRLKVIEALASGLPVVATPKALDGLGVAERGLAVVGTDAGELVEGAVRLLADSAERRNLSREGRQYVAANFDWRIIAAGLEATIARAARVHLVSPRQ